MTIAEISMGILQAASVVFAGIAVLYAAKRVRLLSEIHRENHDWNRRCEAQKAVVAFRHLQPTYMKLHEMFDIKNIQEPIRLETILDQVKADKALDVEIRELLNAFEGLARGIRQAVYDEGVVKAARRGSMIGHLDAFSLYIRHVRKINPKLYCDWESLVNRWKNEECQAEARSPTGMAKC